MLLSGLDVSVLSDDSDVSASSLVLVCETVSVGSGVIKRSDVSEGICSDVFDFSLGAGVEDLNLKPNFSKLSVNKLKLFFTLVCTVS